ncbi:S9 family peptidase [Cellulomonas humilata]|uniref:Dipeptidyl aminopeptidase/acylaminoacyl peptidase n=1 Tax=Cellulomonas humilata TaxID=144055 RepID=A0ABU0EGL4_9CELL|nr:S9 family peptidase [Cellulomonas humilata]MDQ0374400.1 dipeptidyl aminopeptidase/acylaminoacyl peptidase [Cellulomonas humilata]
MSVVRPDLTADEYVGHLWSVDLEGANAPRALTRGHRDTSPEVSPDGRWVAFLRAEPEGKPQVHVVEATGGEPIRLTDAPLGASEPRFSPDGTRIAYVARVPEEGRYAADGKPGNEDPRHITELKYRSDGVGFFRDRPQHVFVVDVPVDGERPAELSEPVALTAGDVGVSGVRWLPSGDALVGVSARHGSRESDLRSDAVRVDASPSGAPGAPVPLTDADAGSTLGVDAVLPSADGSTLWLLAGDLGPSGRDFVATQSGLYRLALDGTGAVPVRLTDPEQDQVTAVVAELDGDPLVVVERRGAAHLVRVAADGTATTLVGGTHVVSGAAVAGSSGRVVATAATPTSAGEVLLVDVAAGTVEARTDLGAALRATGRTRVPVELVATAPDGYEVHGWAVTPDEERYGAGPHPTILMIHGGPFAQYTHGLFDEVQVLAEAGYAVVLGNPRGSSGYGRAHGLAIRQGFGTVDTDDVLALLGAALEDPALDGERVGVMGGSYGGYLTAWLTTRTDRFVAAVVERGFLDPISFVGSSDIGWFFGLEYLGDTGDEAGAAALAAQSPMAHVGRVRTPTLVIHSEQDWRCPVEQGQRWFVELKRRGVHAELLLFPGEGHELTRSGNPKHRAVRFEHVLRWWSTHLPVES